MRIQLVIALSALSIAGAYPHDETGRSVINWLFEPKSDVFQEAGVEPAELREEGRRRSDRKDGDKDVSVSINISKNKNRPNSNGGHNTPYHPIAGIPIIVAGNSPASKPDPIPVVVEEDANAWGWGWIKGFMNPPSWGAWGNGGHHQLPSWSYGDKNSGSGSGNGNRPTPCCGHGSNDDDDDHHGDDNQSGGSGVSLSYGKPPSNFYDTHSSWNYNPFSGWWQPNFGDKGDYGYGYDNDYGRPSTSEVLVIQYPDFIKTIGKGLSKMTNAMRDLGKGVSDTINKGIEDTGAAIGSGVYSIIPLNDVASSQHQPGSDDQFNTGSGFGPSFKPHIIPHIHPHTHSSSGGSPSSSGGCHGAGCASGSSGSSSGPSQTSSSTVYVDKHANVPQISLPAPPKPFGSSWFPSDWFGYGYDSGHGSGSGSGSDSGSSSTVYVNKNPGGLFGTHSHPHTHED